MICGRQRGPQEHSQEWLCHEEGESGIVLHCWVNFVGPGSEFGERK